MQDVKIYVITHKKYDHILKIPYDYYIPILCGKQIFNPNEESKIDNIVQNYVPELGDNTGDNISYKNRTYCELTGYYWVWKNDNSSPDDIVGINHYRRFFSERDDTMKFLTKESIISELGYYDFLVNGCDSVPDHMFVKEEDSVYSQYKGCHSITDMDVMIEGVNKYYPELYPSINRELKESGAISLCNMIITRKKLFDEYCEFLFTILGYVEDNINLNDGRDDYNKRAFGFLAERILRPYIVAKGYKSKSASCLDWPKYAGIKED